MSDGLNDIIKKIINLVMLNEDAKKYEGDVVKILGLFDNLDYFDKYLEDLHPLYHPLEEDGIPRDDEVKIFKILKSDLKPYINEEGYVVASPIKGVKKIRGKK